MGQCQCCGLVGQEAGHGLEVPMPCISPEGYGTGFNLFEGVKLLEVDIPRYE